MKDYIILKVDIKRALKSLKLKEKLIIRLIFYEGYSESEAAKRVKVGRSRIRNIKGCALRKLKEILI